MVFTVMNELFFKMDAKLFGLASIFLGKERGHQSQMNGDGQDKVKSPWDYLKVKRMVYTDAAMLRSIYKLMITAGIIMAVMSGLICAVKIMTAKKGDKLRAAKESLTFKLVLTFILGNVVAIFGFILKLVSEVF